MVCWYRTTIINLCCKNSIKLERAEKIRGKSGIRTLRKHSHALIAESPLDKGETLSNDSGVTGVVVLLVAQAKRKASASEKIV